ncbi:AAA family ATPase [Kutzneria sp. NPDC051319]|uniref:AAA family ATPase n=1 Tax=Kutzneria sp. NPDC051319 TaxID=3155047 RepID=UPI00343FEFB3
MAVLWLCGPPGVGKTTVAWLLYTQLVEAGVRTGFVDIDQLGMCYPAPASDPERYGMKARNLGAVVSNLDAGRVVVSGVTDPVQGMPRIPGTALTMCRLRVDEGQLRARLERRGWPAEQIEAVRQEAEILDAAGGICVDTTGLTVAEVVRRVRERTGWPDPAGRDEPTVEEPVGAVDGEILWLCGATGVGKSAVGFAVYQRILRAGRTAAYVDLDQLGFRGPTPAGHGVRARNLAALWRTYRAAGAQQLVVVGPAENEAVVATYADALPGAKITLCRLHAGPGRLMERIMLRGRGQGWAQPGDPLLGRPIAYLRQVADRAAAEADALERVGLGRRVDAGPRTVEQVADAVLA